MVRSYVIHLCGGNPVADTMPDPDCPQAASHTLQPSGYLEWHEWAAKMSKTHHQMRCPGCGLLNIWRPKQPEGS